MNTEPDPPTAPLRTARSNTGAPADLGAPSRPESGARRAGTTTLDSRSGPGRTDGPDLSEAPTGAIPIQRGPRSLLDRDPAQPAEDTARSAEPTGVRTGATQTIDRATGRAGADRAGTTTDRAGAAAGRAGAAADRAGPTPEPRARLLLVPVLVGAAVAVALGAYGRLHEPTGLAVSVAGFSSIGYVKAWLATATVLFGLLQLGSAMVLYGRVVVRPPTWIGGLHRWSGRIAVLASVPVAVQCLYALGFQSDSTRVWVHSILGCLFYGAFATKMLSLSRPGAPRWAMPLLGGLVFAGLIGLWLTSALWLFSARGVHL
ncbi:MAG: hypothetical protein QOD96_5503 [Pseudonocardiales bacterium]|nr:hypothetical protein [Pseudonocardiales bacterium]